MPFFRICRTFKLACGSGRNPDPENRRLLADALRPFILRRTKEQVAPELALERLRECSELQDSITATKRRRLVGSTVSVLVDRPGVGRTYREAPEIDGIVQVPRDLEVGELHEVVVTVAEGPDLSAEPASRRTSGLVAATMVSP